MKSSSACIKSLLVRPSIISGGSSNKLFSLKAFNTMTNKHCNNFSSNLFNYSAAANATSNTTTTTSILNEEETTTTTSLNNDNTSQLPVFTKEMVAKHYESHHIPLSHAKFHTYGSTEHTNPSELEGFQVDRSFSPLDLTDKSALAIMKFLRVLVHAFFGNKYLHHAVVLETVAAIPGSVSAMLRHFSSLRSMRRDHGHIGELLEEAENERMHLLTWMEMTKPTLIERLLVVGAQFGFTTFYTMAYTIHPRFCHRLVGYLEEEAVKAYSEFLMAIDSGDIPNIAAPDIAIKYWNLKPDATMRDVVLVVRADECMHRDYNHDMSNRHRAGLKI